jgi:RNA polymerase sigma-70 factor (sigma-E family)
VAGESVNTVVGKQAAEAVLNGAAVDDTVAVSDSVAIDESVAVSDESVAVSDSMAVSDDPDAADAATADQDAPIGADASDTAEPAGAPDPLVPDQIDDAPDRLVPDQIIVPDQINLSVVCEPLDGAGRPMDVTETLTVDAVMPEIAFAPEPTAPEALQAHAAWEAAEAVTEIYRSHYSQLVRLSVLLVHDVQTAEEVVQEAFEAMHQAWKRLRDSEKALQYLRQTVVNKSRSVLRHRKVVDLHAPKPAPDEPSAEHAALAVLERSAVAAALRTLPERQREAIALRYYADFSEADIAAAMGISRGAVKSHTARAMAALKSILTQETP